MNRSLEILKDKSMIIAMEELAELQQAISKMLRGKGNYDNLAEEIADVRICLQWVMEYYNVKYADVDKWEAFKYNRISERIIKGELK